MSKTKTHRQTFDKLSSPAFWEAKLERSVTGPQGYMIYDDAFFKEVRLSAWSRSEGRNHFWWLWTLPQEGSADAWWLGLVLVKRINTAVLWRSELSGPELPLRCLQSQNQENYCHPREARGPHHTCVLCCLLYQLRLDIFMVKEIPEHLGICWRNTGSSVLLLTSVMLCL